MAKRDERKIKTIFLISLIGITILLSLVSCDTTDPPPVKEEPDTTSQDFTFETIEFGNGYQTSYLNDVWIFDKNNAWAVGYIQCDTVSNANILRWNGKEWYVEKYEGHSSGINGIWALDTAHIYFADGGIAVYKNGVFEKLDLGYLHPSQGQSIDHIWGSSESNIWGVGKLGAMVHYDGKEWKKIDFDRQWIFTNITGSKERETVYAVGHNGDFTTIIVELKPKSQKIIYSGKHSSDPPGITGILSVEKDYLCCSDDDIWEYNLKTSDYKILKEYPGGYGLYSISGKSPNDVYYFGSATFSGQKLIHFNGVRHKEFTLLENDYLMNCDSDAIKDLAILVGFHNHKAYIQMIRRR